MIKINNEKQLLAFLKQITKNTILESNQILDSDPYTDHLEKGFKKNKKIFEQEEDPEADSEEAASEEEEDSEENSETELTQNDSGKSSKEKMTPAAKKAMDLPGYGDDSKPTYETLSTAINILRAGNSLSDGTTKTELQDYFKRLDDNEREVLILFLKEIAKILTGAVDGEDAQDPSDPSSYFTITKRSEEEAADKKKKAEQTEQTDDIPEKQPAQQGQKISFASPDNKSLEDTTPPIRVNESQDVYDLKIKVKKLMRS